MKSFLTEGLSFIMFPYRSIPSLFSKKKLLRDISIIHIFIFSLLTSVLFREEIKIISTKILLMFYKFFAVTEGTHGILLSIFMIVLPAIMFFIACPILMNMISFSSKHSNIKDAVKVFGMSISPIIILFGALIIYKFIIFSETTIGSWASYSLIIKMLVTLSIVWGTILNTVTWSEISGTPIFISFLSSLVSVAAPFGLIFYFG